MKFFKHFSVSLLALALAPGAALAQGADFSGKTIEWVIPFAEGGGTDRWARFYAPLLSDHLPGNPEIVVKNEPAGASIIGANRFARSAKPDGLTILGTSATTQFPFLLGDKRVEYDYDDWTIVLGSPVGGVIYASPALGVKGPGDIADLSESDIPLTYAGQGATGIDIVPLLALELLALDPRPSFGARGRKIALEKFQRGEVQIDFQTTPSYLKSVQPLVEKGEAIPLFSFGILDKDGNLSRDPTFPDMPHFGEAHESIHGKPPEGEGFEAWKIFLTAGFSAQKMVFLPKGTSREIITTYRDAFKAAVESDAFAEQAEELLGVYPQATGGDAHELKEIATRVNSRQRAWITNWLVNEAFPKWAEAAEE